jgi:hypothetical protein
MSPQDSLQQQVRQASGGSCFALPLPHLQPSTSGSMPVSPDELAVAANRARSQSVHSSPEPTDEQQPPDTNDLFPPPPGTGQLRSEFSNSSSLAGSNVDGFGAAGSHPPSHLRLGSQVRIGSFFMEQPHCQLDDSSGPSSGRSMAQTVAGTAGEEAGLMFTGQAVIRGRRTRRKSNLRAAAGATAAVENDAVERGAMELQHLPAVPEGLDEGSTAELVALRGMWTAAPYSDAAANVADAWMTVTSEAHQHVARIVAAAAEVRDAWVARVMCFMCISGLLLSNCVRIVRART